MFKVKWSGFDDKSATWEPSKNIPMFIQKVGFINDLIFVLCQVIFSTIVRRVGLENLFPSQGSNTRRWLEKVSILYFGPGGLHAPSVVMAAWTNPSPWSISVLFSGFYLLKLE